MSVDTPGDLHWFNSIMTGVEVRCVEWDRVKVEKKKYKGKEYNHILCPPGCVKSDEDVKRKCGIRYDITLLGLL